MSAENEKMKIRFLGGIQTVTGSKSLVTAGKHQYLVDCGLFQGLKELRLRNWSEFPVNPRGIEAVLLTHAHLDHSGYLPLLVKQGFRGRIFCTSPTFDLVKIILADSARLQEEDAGFANQRGYSRHRPAKALYTGEDVSRALEHFVIVRPEKWEELPGGARFRFTPSGHILGSAFIELEWRGTTIAFSGDLGRRDPLLYPAPGPIEKADYLVVESTYGDRTHHDVDVMGMLGQAVCDTAKSGGKLVIPSFAVGRVQDLLHLLAKLKAQERIPSIPIYLDTPMGLRATEIFTHHPRWHRLSGEEVDAMWRAVRVVESQRQSIDVMRDPDSSVIIAGSGMLTGGRVLHHLETWLPDPKSTVLLVGFQAAGTRGRILREGASEVKIHGHYVPVRARILEITGLSAHADQSEILSWLRSFKAPPRMTFINHGEPQASDALRVRIGDELGWKSIHPALDQEYELEPLLEPGLV